MLLLMDMNSRLLLLCCLLCCGLSLRLVLGDKDGSLNLSSLVWATSVDEEDLLKTDIEDTLMNDAEGGFNSLDSMLQWAIGHSDPEKLKGAAHEVQKLSASELENRRAAIKELMESLRIPSDADLMKIAISDLQNSSSSFNYRYRALQELLEFVEPIDNANDLHKLGGLVVVVNELDRPEEDLRVLAAWVLGKASQNNGLVQDQLLALGVLPKLMQMARSSSAEEAVKALYAVSAIIRNHPDGQEAFYLQGGSLLLEEIMRNSSADARLHRKSLFIVADLAEQQKEIGGTLAKYKPSKGYLISVVDLISSQDLDTQEKALMAIRSLSASSGVMHNMLINDCNVVSALKKLQVQLNDLIQTDDQLEFARDLQELCESVMSMFTEDAEISWAI